MSNKPRVEIREVTPDWARKIIEKHNKSIEDGSFRQRPINERLVKQYANDMKAGNWGLNNQGISFDVDGNLLDGQKRLTAVILCGIPVDMSVMWDLPKEVNQRVKTIDTFDTGQKRLLAQQLKIEGFAYYGDVASATRMLLHLASDIEKPNLSPSQGIAVANLMKNNIIHIVQVLRKDHRSAKSFPGAIIAPIVLLHTAQPDSAELFATEFNEMTNLSKTSPVLQFARFLERPSHSKGGTDYSLLVMSALSSALYAYCNDKRVERITGNKEHVEWLLKTAKNCVSKIREVAGITLTMEELKEKG